MKITAIIAEYNPFHEGHKFHIEQARKLTGADAILVIMSGNFVQRGEPAIFDKHLRTKVAVSSGADMIIELPYPYSCSSAEYFADSAVNILDKLGCVDYLCFGSECNDIEAMTDIARIIIDESDAYKDALKDNLKNGLSFPKARAMALMNVLGDSKYEEILSSPNNILGIEYIKSLLKLGSSIKPVTIKREVSSYHHSEDNNPMYSASSIREALFNNEQIDLSDVSNLYNGDSMYVTRLDDFSSILVSRLLEHHNILDDYFDISSDLADRIRNNIDKYTSVSAFIELLKTKNITYTAISRGLCHIMLGLKQCDMNAFRGNGYADFVRVLGFNDKGLSIVKLIEKTNNIKTITKMSKADEILSDLPEYNKKLFDYNLYADNLYRMVVQGKYDVKLANEYQHQVKI